ncbi:hypothetical protein EMPG_10136 [Blastomyces silverae]|uniref:Uncharacterized protein n=1 Tax=Blastomyces silverae TaxID=2060906 RepID=A0A0H1B4Z8_9EURO|nr:hypothetical protein EMPG_10136 [Blastomyces silverae]
MARILEISKKAYGRFHSICRSAKARIRRSRNTKPAAQEPSSEPAVMPKPAVSCPSPPPTPMTSRVGSTAGSSHPSSSRSSYSPPRSMTFGVGSTAGSSHASSSRSSYSPPRPMISGAGSIAGNSHPSSIRSSHSPPRPMISGIGASPSSSRPPSTPPSSLDENPFDEGDILGVAPVAGFRLPSRKAQLIMQAHRFGQEHGCPVSYLNFQGWLACIKLNTAVYFRSNATIVDGELILKLDVAKRAINPSLKAYLQIGVLDNMVPELYLKFSKFCFDQRGADSSVFIQYPNSDAEVRATMVTDPRTKVREMRVTLWCNLGECESPIDQRRDNNAGSYHDPSLLGDCRIIDPEESLYMKHFDDKSPSKFGDYLSSGRMLAGAFGK